MVFTFPLFFSAQVETWLNGKAVLAVRFLGTTPGSSTIVPMLTSICSQLSVVYNLPLEDIPEELAPLIQYYKKLLYVPTVDKPLVLFLDSLDQLSCAEGAHQLTWFPVHLPENVKVIASTLPDYYGLLDALKIMIEDEANFIQASTIVR